MPARRTRATADAASSSRTQHKRVRGEDSRERGKPLPATEDELYEHFLVHAKHVRLKFPPVTDPWPPHEQDLPCDDGMPADSPRHWTQRVLLLQTLRDHWADRPLGYVAVNMGLYFNIDQQHKTYDWLDPDFFAVLGAAKRERLCWVEWDEGRGPDVVIELMSPSTYHRDKVERRRIYQDTLHVPEYFWYDPFTEELAGLRLRDHGYEVIEPDADGSLFSDRLGLCLVRRDTLFMSERGRYLRFATPSGVLLPTLEERRDILAARHEAERRAPRNARPATVATWRPEHELRQRLERVRRDADAFLQRSDLDDEARRDIERRLRELDESMHGFN